MRFRNDLMVNHMYAYKQLPKHKDNIYQKHLGRGMTARCGASKTSDLEQRLGEAVGEIGGE